MFIGLIIAIGIIAYFIFGLAVANLLPQRWPKYYINLHRLDMWLIRIVAVFAILFSRRIYLTGETDSFWGQLWPNLFTLGLTILAIDELNRQRSQRQYKRQIIQQMRSRSNDFALEAIRIAQNEGWMQDGSLRGATLYGANLQNASLFAADLRGAFLGDANLKDTFIAWGNLDGAILKNAKYNKNTVWPDDFDPKAAGAILEED